MSNPLYPQNNPFGNINAMLSQFNDFKKQFQGNPEEQVKSLLQSGQMSQQQFDELSQIAKNFQNILR